MSDQPKPVPLEDIPDLQRAPLTVCVDFHRPSAGLAVAPVKALAARLNIDVHWLPLRIPARQPPRVPDAAAPRGSWHRYHRAIANGKAVRQQAANQGFDRVDPFDATDYSLARTALAWINSTAPKRAAAFVQAAFETIWKASGDLTQPETVHRLLDALNLAADVFRTEQNSAANECRALQARLESAGLFDVPAIITRTDVFYGREHLPIVAHVLRSERER